MPAQVDRERLRQLIEQLVRDELSRLRNEPNRSLDPEHNQATKGRRVITASDIESAAQGSKQLIVPDNAIVTPLARDRAQELGVELIGGR